MQGVLSTFSTNSQNGRILAYLQSGKSLTCLEAIKKGLSHNLRSRIADLKRKGYKVKSVKENFNGGFVARYSLEVKNGN